MSAIQMPAKPTRSLSNASTLSASSTASTMSQRSLGLLEAILAAEPSARIDLWSAGNLRLSGVDLTVPSHEALELVEALNADADFELVDMALLGEGDEWRVSYLRSPVSSPLAPAA
ncbi:hypothetical protein Q5752_005660 [Cryptotrichosporon argae]